MPNLLRQLVCCSKLSHNEKSVLNTILNMLVNISFSDSMGISSL